MACALTPYKGITYVDEKGKTRSAVESVIREGLKIGTKNHYLDGIPSLFSASELLKAPVIDEDKFKFKTPSERATIGLYADASLCCPMSTKAMVQGLLLRHTSVHNAHIDAHWTTSLLFSLIQELVDCYDTSKDRFNSMSRPFVLNASTH
jgi:tRNA nucleotidyltransferase (CCA-adding enzyme)